ncbi:MAG TPA: hypothetical protein DIW52_06250 [Pseudomonas sp.]|nr:hypothetical protein [Pseudomonas sp.]
MHVNFKLIFCERNIFLTQLLSVKQRLDVILILLTQVQRSTKLRKLMGLDRQDFIGPAVDARGNINQ